MTEHGQTIGKHFEDQIEDSFWNKTQTGALKPSEHSAYTGEQRWYVEIALRNAGIDPKTPVEEGLQLLQQANKRG
jgi:hypothetical protein